jgi:hypothetical protein
VFFLENVKITTPKSKTKETSEKQDDEKNRSSEDKNPRSPNSKTIQSNSQRKPSLSMNSPPLKQTQTHTQNDSRIFHGQEFEMVIGIISILEMYTGKKKLASFANSFRKGSVDGQGGSGPSVNPSLHGVRIQNFFDKCIECEQQQPNTNTNTNTNTHTSSNSTSTSTLQPTSDIRKTKFG